MSGKSPFQMKTVHRVGAVIAALLMLYLGATGTMMQLLDLHAILSHAPESDPTMLSIHEGENGGFDFAVLSVKDLDAAPLPSDLDYEQALTTTLAATHQAAPATKPRFVELRMSGASPIGQAGLGKDLKAFDLGAGGPTATVTAKPSRPPPSPRQQLKELHRFWSRKDVPGVWFELLSGLVLWGLIITGLTLYFRMLSGRMKLGRNNPFWMAGGAWRSLHRMISVAAAVFLIAIAASGAWLGFESVWHLFGKRTRIDMSAPLDDATAIRMASATLTAFRRLEPETPIKVLRVRIYGPMKQGVVITGGEETRQLIFNTETGKVTTLAEPGYPSSGFPLGVQVHEDVKHFHSGHMFGLPARAMNLFAGLSLIFLSVSGLVMYADLWLRRRKLGRNGLFWV